MDDDNESGERLRWRQCGRDRTVTVEKGKGKSGGDGDGDGDGRCGGSGMAEMTTNLSNEPHSANMAIITTNSICDFQHVFYRM